jgi:prepilin-type N-terminal cleavage/methylation domain-containing protein
MMKGFSLVELIVVMLVISIVASIGFPAGKKMYDSYQVEATVETMKFIAAAADVARQLPGGDTLQNSDTTSVYALLNANQQSLSGIKATPMINHWGGIYSITTTGKSASVSTTIPIGNTKPFGANSYGDNSQSTLIVSHRSQATNYGALMRSVANKNIMYLESNSDEEASEEEEDE